ncbi:MAG: hypothetical protein ACTSQE_17110 [Candidatus Heimdallarchaeaceae archaeon]
MTVTKKQLVGITFIPILILSLLDLITTYYGVCVHGGIELKLSGIKIIQTYGFLLGGIIYISKNMLISLLLYGFLWKGRESEVTFVFIMVVVVLFITELANVVVLNVNTLLYQTVGTGFAPADSNSKDITPKQAEEILETFDRDNFCRWI